MKSRMFSWFILLSTNLVLASAIVCPSADARGGGGGGGGRGGGGFGGGRGGGFGGGDRGGWGDNRGAWGGDFGDRGGWGEGGRGGFGSRGDLDGGRSFQDHPAVSEAALRSGANQEYHWGGSLPTDGGFGRAAGVAAGSGITRNVSAGTMASRGAAVRAAYNHYDAFNRDFWNRYRGGWWYPWWGDDWAWGYTGWGDLSGFWGYPPDDEPVAYDYGDNITYQDNSVYYGDQPMESQEAYYDQAQALALSAPPSTPPAVPAAVAKGGTRASSKGAASKAGSKPTDWKPLGVFALTQGDQTDSNSIFQLAVDKNGIVRGNYFNPLTQEEQPIQGKVDKKNKRVAWTVGSNKEVVYDTGLANLLSKQSSLLIHLSKSNTQQWNLIRLEHAPT